ncbi:MAG: hypothetical protein ACSLFE_00470 [Gemmatimonadaceae bacterium]
MLKLDRWIERALVIAGLVLLSAAFFHMYSTLNSNVAAARVEARQAKAEATVARAEAATWKDEAAELTAKLAAASQRAAVSDQRAGAAATTYRALRDTVAIADTAAVRAVLVAADSAVNEAERSRDLFRLALAAADSVITAKDGQIAALDREAAALRRQVAATERQIPSRFGRSLSAMKWVGLGLVAGAVLTQ